MFTSVCTTSSYWRMLEEEMEQKRGKEVKLEITKVQLEPPSALLGLLQFRQMTLLPFTPLNTAGSRAVMLSAQTKNYQLCWEHCKSVCALKLERGNSLQDRGQQLRPDGTAAAQTWPIFLAPRRKCSHTHLDSSPVASTPKCSHTAGQNCSLQVMKSSSRLQEEKGSFNNPAQEEAEGCSQKGQLRSLRTSSFTMGKGICPWIQ